EPNQRRGTRRGRASSSGGAATSRGQGQKQQPRRGSRGDRRESRPPWTPSSYRTARKRSRSTSAGPTARSPTRPTGSPPTPDALLVVSVEYHRPARPAAEFGGSIHRRVWHWQHCTYCISNKPPCACRSVRGRYAFVIVLHCLVQQLRLIDCLHGGAGFSLA
ncbi:Extradiol ring-cleavage dioxygenase, partial [Zea mays]